MAWTAPRLAATYRPIRTLATASTTATSSTGTITTITTTITTVTTSRHLPSAQWVIEEAEAHAARVGGWNTRGHHDKYPTCDVVVAECEALLEDEPRAFLGLLEEDEGDALEAVACAVNPRARVTPIAPGSCPDEDVRMAFEIEICASAPEREREPLSDLVRSNILDFGFRSGGDARSV